MAQSLKQQFVEWVGRQPRERGYDYSDPGQCAFCLFLADLGYAKVPRVVTTDWRDGLFSDDRHPLPEGLDLILRQAGWTFGALADRLAQASL